MYCSWGVSEDLQSSLSGFPLFSMILCPGNSKSLCPPGLSALSLHLMKSPGLCLHFSFVSQLRNSFHPVSWGSPWTQLIHFISFQVHCSSLPDIQMLEKNSLCKRYSKDKYKTNKKQRSPLVSLAGDNYN